MSDINKKLISFISLMVTTQLITVSSCSSSLAAFVVTGGGVLKNQTNTPAEDARIGFRIPSFFGGEKILGGKINIMGASLQQIVEIGNTGLSSFDEDIIFVDQDGGSFVSIPPDEPVFIDIIFDSKKKNAVKWLKTVYLTDSQGNELATQTGLAGFVVEPKKTNSPSPQNSTQSFASLIEPQLSYTFTNDGNTELSIDSITLGKSLDFIEPSIFSPTMLSNSSFFDNNGSGWTLFPDEEISLDVPFNLEGGSFLVADIIGTMSPGQADAFPVRFIQEHEQPTPEPNSTLSLLSLGLLGGGVTLKRKLKSANSTEKEITKVG